jgi:putative transposase
VNGYGARLAGLISIVSYATFRKWVRRLEDAPGKRPVSTARNTGRPRLEESLSEAIIRIKNETGWGYTKIVQAIRQLGHTVARQTVKNVLLEAGLGPEPSDHRDTWSEFLTRHAATLWQCDFASKCMWTIKGMVDLYFLVFIHIESRRIWVSACTARPTGEWTAQQARNFDIFLEEEHLPCSIVQRDRDTKYVQAFDDVFTGNGRTVKLTPVRSPNLQAFVERVIQTLKHEVLNGFCVVSESHLDRILRIGADWYNRRRGHTGLRLDGVGTRGATESLGPAAAPNVMVGAIGSLKIRPTGIQSVGAVAFFKNNRCPICRHFMASRFLYRARVALRSIEIGQNPARIRFRRNRATASDSTRTLPRGASLRRREAAFFLEPAFGPPASPHVEPHGHEELWATGEEVHERVGLVNQGLEPGQHRDTAEDDCLKCGAMS